MTHIPSVSAKLLPSRMKDRRSALGIVPASMSLSGNVSGTNTAQPASCKRQNNGRRDQIESSTRLVSHRSILVLIVLFPMNLLLKNLPSLEHGQSKTQPSLFSLQSLG